MALSRRRQLVITDSSRPNDLPKQLERSQDEQNPGPRAVPELSADEQNTAHLHRQNFGTHVGQIVFGKITYTTPYAHWYRVQLDDGDADLPCCQVTDSAVTPFSVRSTGPIPPGTPVLVYKPPEGFFGYIIGAIPDIVTDGSLVHPDWISQGSNMGFKREIYYHGIMSLFAEHGSVVDFSNNRPVDSSALGEWGKFSDLGGGIHIDPFFVFLRISETCGLFLHYLDELTRLEGHNLDVRSAVSEWMIRNDSSEGLNYHGSSPYLWEALGAFEAYTEAHREISDEDVQYNDPYGKFEPLHDDQQPFYRVEEFKGYLGQAWLRQVLLPPQADSGSVHRYGDNSVAHGVFREHVGLDGSYGMQSAHSIVFAKRSLIPAGKRLQPPEAKKGDNVEDGEYRFAGVYGEGDEHKIGDVDPGDDRPNLIRAVGFDDFLAHLFNWKNLHPFHYHSKDFFLPEQDELAPFNSIQLPPSFSQLLSQTWLDPTSPVPLKVDHRYGDVDYYETQASFSLLPDGSSVWRGAGGEEIRFLGGSIQISCPGDILLQPGRSLVGYGGDDIVMRANKSLDLTANQKDVRIKAEANLELLGGNGGYGRTLIESKSVGFSHDYEGKVGEEIQGSGILLKSADSQIVGWGAEIYLRTGGGDVSPGPIVLDADQGGQSINTISRDFVRHLESVALDYFPSKDGKAVANSFTAYNTQIQTPCQFDGGVTITEGGMLMKGYLAILGGHVGSEFADDYDFLVGWYDGQPLRQAEIALLRVLQGMEQARNNGDEHYLAAFDERYYQDGQVGHDDVIENTQFSLRNEEQYGTENWELPETYWQQLARESNQASNNWTENPVPYQGQELAPHPGYQRWQEDSWLTLALTMHDHATGKDERRDSRLYEEPTFGEWDKLPPDGNYPVISGN